MNSDQTQSEAPHLAVSCATDRGVYAGYWKVLKNYELSAQDLSTKANRLRAWREQAPQEGSFVSRISDQVISEMFSDQRGISSKSEAEIARALTRVEALNSDLLLLQTPSSIRPSQTHEAAIIKLRERLPSSLPLAWRADGLWSESEAFYDLCAAQNIIPVLDPLMWEEDEPLPKGSFAYWKIMGGQGLSVRLSEYDLDKLLDLADQWFANQDQESPYKLWANFTSPKMIPLANRWQDMF
ncbi:MAG: hypothetical protein CMH49_00970 [Myxococcales bacterium]|nr:hypothetical protein [Myxococcales bacterium]